MNTQNQKTTIVKSSNNSKAESLRNQLPIKTYNNENVVNARELHKRLQVSVRFNDWITRRVHEYDFIEGVEFYSNLSKTPKQGGRPKKDYFVTIEMAKELAMVERNEIGRQMRRYFIEIEKRYRTEVLQPAVSGLFGGLTGVMFQGHKCYPYTGVLRNLGYSARSGSVQERKKRYAGQFFKLFGRNFITTELAEFLMEQKLVRQQQRSLQMALPFETTSKAAAL